MKKSIYVMLTVLAFTNCAKDQDFLIAKGQVGKVLATTQVHELKDLFKNDSLVSRIGNGELSDAAYDEYLVYNKEGHHMLTLIPKVQNDSTSTVESVQIFDPNYKTASGVGLNSTYSDVVDHYIVNKVESTFTTAVLFVNELNATMAISKKELGLKDFDPKKIVAAQIPDLAKLKTITIWFD
ncbi:hypothetical protein MWU59_05700 [Flavobacteriaceae bacterium F08102]|nr:hypothetical protein [Flavobacteriaceae bacterium F08102]